MLERFTVGARSVVIDGSREEARRLGHDYIGTEHLVLAMTRADLPSADLLRSLGAGHQVVDAAVRELLGLPRLDLDRDALAALGIDVDEVRSAVESTFGPGALDEPGSRRGNPDPAVRPRFTRRAKKTLELAVRETIRFKQQDINDWALLLGILREGEGLGCRALVRCSVDLSALRGTVEARLRPAA